MNVLFAIWWAQVYTYNGITLNDVFGMKMAQTNRRKILENRFVFPLFARQVVAVTSFNDALNVFVSAQNFMAASPMTEWHVLDLDPVFFLYLLI